MRHGLVGAVDGQRVLDQVVGADGDEIKMLQQAAHHDGGGGNLDHRAQLHRPLGHAPRLQLGLGQPDLLHDAVHLVLVRHHGEQQLHRAQRRGAQDGAQLGAEHRGLGQAPADGAQPQRGVQRDVAADFVQRLVGPHIDGADRHRQALHALHGGLVGLELLLLAGQLAFAPHEQEFAAEQPHAGGPGMYGRAGIAGLLDVRQQLDLLAIQRDRRGVAQARQALALQHVLALAEAVLLQDDGRGVHQHHAGIAVDHHPVILAD